MSHEKQHGKQRVAIVTGGSRGIGAAICKRLAQDGLCVVVNYAAGREAAQAVVAEIVAAGGQGLAVQADVASASDVKALFDSTEKQFGGVDVLINNAGVLTMKTLAETDDATFDRLVSINFKGTFHGLREASRRLRAGGRIVNLSTSVVGLKLERYAVYAATKAAVETMTAILAKELRGRGITVNAVAPGPTATDLFFEGKSKDLVERLIRMSPLERLGTPEDIAAAVAFFVSGEGGWINGQTLRCNGGVT